MVGHSPILGRKGLRLGVIVGPVVLEARLREEVLVGLSSLRGEYTDRSAHPRREGGFRSHDDEAFYTLLLHQALHLDDPLGFSGLSLIAMGRDVRHATVLSFPGIYTTVRSNLAKVSCHLARQEAGPEGVSTCSLCHNCRL